MVEVKNITKTYGRGESLFKALDAISFKIEEGTTVAITGKSGSGKSTLMHVMSGLEKADSGRVLFGDRDVQSMDPKEADKFRANEMSFIFQAFFVEGRQTVYQNISLPLEIAGVSRGQRSQLIERALKGVELLDKITQPAANLSGGQKQRLAIARAIVNKPSIIFADEPTGNLDSQTGEKIMSLLFDFTKKMNTTLFIVTHDIELADKCQIKIELSDGKLIKISKKAGQ